MIELNALDQHDLIQNWDFFSSNPPSRYQLSRIRSRLFLRSRFPQFLPLKEVFLFPQWTVFFIFLPQAILSNSQRYTLDALKKSKRKLFVICASESPKDIPEEIFKKSDALYWKALQGFDFSAYTIGFHEIARSSPDSEVFFLNDSVFGPLRDIDKTLELMNWNFTGFSASSQFENHIQSYAFHLSNVSMPVIEDLGDVLSKSFSYNDIWSTVSCCETRLARVASKKMSVGSLYFSNCDRIDPTLDLALPLLERGFPFVKKSLFGKHFGRTNEALLWQRMVDVGYPSTAF